MLIVVPPTFGAIGLGQQVEVVAVGELMGFAIGPGFSVPDLGASEHLSRHGGVTQN